MGVVVVMVFLLLFHHLLSPCWSLNVEGSYIYFFCTSVQFSISCLMVFVFGCRFGLAEVQGQSGQRPLRGFVKLEQGWWRRRPLFLVWGRVLGWKSGHFVSGICC